MNRPECILWDFGDTLVDEAWMQKPNARIPGWIEAWRSFIESDRMLDWHVDGITTQGAAEYLADILSVAPELIVDHMTLCCQDIDRFEAVWEVVEHTPLPQAIVTINPRIFTDVIVPAYELDRKFRLIIASWEERIADKADLCERAAARLGVKNENAFLIDNIKENVNGWKQRGGSGYHFSGEGQFVADLEDDPGLSQLA